MMLPGCLVACSVLMLHCVFLAQCPVSPICWLHFGFLWLYVAWCWAGVLIVCSLAEKQRAAPPSPICWLPSPRAQRIQHPASPPATALADTKLKNFKSKSVRCDGKLNEFPLCQLHSYTGLTTEHTGSIEKLITANFVFWLLSIVDCRIDSWWLFNLCKCFIFV